MVAVALSRHEALLEILLDMMCSSLLMGCSAAKGPILSDSVLILISAATDEITGFCEAKEDRGIIITALIVSRATSGELYSIGKMTTRTISSNDKQGQMKPWNTPTNSTPSNQSFAPNDHFDCVHKLQCK